MNWKAVGSCSKKAGAADRNNEDVVALIALTMIDNGQRILARKQTLLNTHCRGVAARSIEFGRTFGIESDSQPLAFVTGGYLVWRHNWLRNLGLQSRHMSNRTDRMRLMSNYHG